MRRIATILAPTDLGASGTRVEEILLSEQISAFFLVFSFTVNTVSVMIGNPLKCLSKIEIVDGSEVYFSMSGRAAQARAYYTRGVEPYNKVSLTASDIVYAVVPIPFGRWLWDDMYALRPDVMKNPQLRVTYDEDASNSGATVNSLAMYAYVDGAPSKGNANGYLLAREIKSYAMTASAHEYTDLPVDYPIRRLYLQGLSEDHDTIGLFSTLKVDVDNGRSTPLDVPALDYYQISQHRWPRIVEKLILDAAVTANTVYPTCTQDGELNIDYDATAFVTAQSKFGVGTFTGEKLAITASVDIKKLNATISGRLPHGVIPIDFGDPEVPESWLQVAGVNKIRADILASSDADSGDTATIISEQPVMYGQR